MSDFADSSRIKQLLSRKGEPAAAAAIARGQTIAQAAREGGISVRTLNRRLQDPAYLAGIGRMRRQVLDGILGRLLVGAVTGVEVLIELATSAKSESVRGSSARVLVEHSLSFTELVGITERLEAIETAVNARRHPPALTSGLE